MRRAPALAALLLAGCFAPPLPGGSFLCAPSDEACPTGLHCVCGLCVREDAEAVCGLEVFLDGAPGGAVVREHQPLPITVVARGKDGGPAAGFSGRVLLSFRLPDGSAWADVEPPALELAGGRAEAQVRINRETIPPQAPRIEARFARVTGKSPPVEVLAPRFARDAGPVATTPFAWASAVVGSPSVVHDGERFRMYFVGASSATQVGVGVATSTDGRVFLPAATPVFPAAGAGFSSAPVGAAPFRVGSEWRLAVYAEQDFANQTSGSALWLAASPDGLGAFSLVGAAPVLAPANCAYCGGKVWFPSILQRADGAADEWLMFFGAGRCDGATCMGLEDLSMSIGRARSTDGATFTPEPAPVLSGAIGGEAYLAAPLVRRDGSIYKMWYAFARSFTLGNPCLSEIHVGYATSSDGFYWVRSPSNPVFSLDGTGWEGNTKAILPSAIVPADGHDPASGLFLYYSPTQQVLLTCLPNGIGRAIALP